MSILQPNSFEAFKVADKYVVQVENSSSLPLNIAKIVNALSEFGHLLGDNLNISIRSNGTIDIRDSMGKTLSEHNSGGMAALIYDLDFLKFDIQKQMLSAAHRAPGPGF
ncbi:MAG: hypothetical protein KDJ35_04735 [Alphaproteobacteria bacterium]|nr:hypothetical protein [Alphaproteobacteria bacterium]